MLKVSRTEPSRNGFETAVRAHYRYVFGLVHSKLRNYQDAQDVTQEVFVKAQKNWSTLRDPERPLPWLTQIAMRTATDQMRKRARHRRAVSRLDAPEAAPEPVESRASLIHEALGEMNEEDHMLICLRYQKSLSYQEIADELGITRDAVRGKLYRAHQELRKRVRRNHELQ